MTSFKNYYFNFVFLKNKITIIKSQVLKYKPKKTL
jgi:hypothetical protein